MCGWNCGYEAFWKAEARPCFVFFEARNCAAWLAANLGLASLQPFNTIKTLNNIQQRDISSRHNGSTNW